MENQIVKRSRLAISVLGFVVVVQLAVIGKLALSNRPVKPPFDSPVATLTPSGPPQIFADPVAKIQTEPFRWARVESADYPTYVQNLRSIQCPEQTIRDIIVADVDTNLYAARRRKLQSQQQDLAARPGGGSLGLETLRAEEKALWKEEKDLINGLLGQEGPEQSQFQGDVAADPLDWHPAVMPLAFVVTSNSLAPLSAQQQAMVKRLQQSFLADLDGLDPSSPEYLEKWQQEQPQLDAALKASDNQVYLRLKLQAQRQQFGAKQPEN